MTVEAVTTPVVELSRLVNLAASMLVSEIVTVSLPSPVNPPKGCPFHPRCPKAKDVCKTEVPTLKKYSTNGNEHYASCHLIDLPEIS